MRPWLVLFGRTGDGIADAHLPDAPAAMLAQTI
jgi:hypothetical protein